jgi:hypothetical protein
MPDREDDLTMPADLAPFADALQRLAPQPTHLSRDALLFEAGKAAGTSRVPVWVWPSATGLFAATSLVLAAFLIDPVTSQPVERVVYIERAAPLPALEEPPVHPPVPPEPLPTSVDDHSKAARMLQVRRDVLRWGVDMLPESRVESIARPREESARDLARWLNLPPDTFAHPGFRLKNPTRIEEDDE